MASPNNPTVTTIVTEGLKRGGVVNPSSSQIASASENQLQEVKTDIGLICPDHPYLLTSTIIPCTIAQSRYAWPSDANTLQSVTLLDAPDSFRGTATAGTTTTITLAADFDAASQDVQGKYLCLMSGTGSPQYRQIITYNNSTKVATVDSAWSTSPTSGTTYLIASYHRRLFDTTNRDDLAYSQIPYGQALPTAWASVGQEIWLDRAPDRAYALLVVYFADLDQLDESGSLFIRLLREWRSLWIQGIAVKTMQRYDDERYSNELVVYNGLLASFASKASAITQARFTDV
jgi:hypothetical protein